MSAIASRLGITRSNFTKIVSRLEAKRLVKRCPRHGSRKEMLVTVLPLGRALYAEYSKEILRWHFAPMFRELEAIPPEDRDHMRDALFAAMAGSHYWKEKEKTDTGA